MSRPRTIITADPELDDLNSMIRLLLFSNELSIEGLVYASSRFHWRGDGEGTPFFLPDREYAEPRTSWRWAQGERFIDDALDAYAEVHGNLVVHDPRYPSPEELRAVVREGNVDFEGDTSHESPGSRLIADALLDDRPGPLHLQMWAGPSTVARALMSIEERHRDSPEWPQVHAAVSAKAVITKFASQDDTYDDYIRPHWPDIRVTDVMTYAWGYLTRKTVRPDDEHLLGATWMRENVTGVGALGGLYRVWGDGRQMVEGDPTDYFHLSGFTADELRAQGYGVWTEPQAAGEWISEGDTPNTLHLLVPGLRGHEHPSYGGWGGRARRTDVGTDTWAIEGVEDADGEDSSVTRWFADAQADFAARLVWSVTPRYEDAAHHPVLHVDPGGDHEIAAGESLRLSAVATDPDGGDVDVRWWIYDEAGTSSGELAAAEDRRAATVTAPRDARAGDTIHVIVEARKDSPRPLTAYRRVILTVRG